MADPFRNEHQLRPPWPPTAVQGFNRNREKQQQASGSRNRPPRVGNSDSPSRGQKQHGGYQHLVAGADQAAMDAHKEALATGETITAFKIIQSMLSILKVDSLDSLGLRIQDIPSLYKIVILEGKVNAFVQCYVAVRRITTLYDLSVDICRHEEVEDFERLGLGPLVRHPLIMHYFAPPEDIVTAFKITTEQIVSHLSVFLYKHHEKNKQVEEFLSFLAKKQKVSSPEQLCIHVRSLGMHIRLLWGIKQVEKDLARKVEAEIAKEKEIERKKKLSELQSNVTFDLSNLSINNNFGGSECDPKYVMFEKDRSSDDDVVLYRKKAMISATRKTDHQFQKSSSSCPLASEEEEWSQLKSHLSTEKFVVGSSDYNEDLGGSKLQNASRRKKNILQSKKSLGSDPCPSTEEERTQVGQELLMQEFTYGRIKNVVISGQELIIFIAAWRNVCRELSVSQVLKTMLEMQGTITKKGWKWSEKKLKRLCNFFTMQPAIGLLNVAVISMKMGLWDTILELNQQEGIMTKETSREETQVQSPEEESSILSTKTGLSACDIIQRVIKFFEVDSIECSQEGELATAECFIMLRKILHCEKWVVKQFSVQDFACLGFGDFLNFLENNLSQLPLKISKMSTAHKATDSPVIAYVARNQLLHFLSQAAWELGDDTMLTKEEISVLLHKQFPFISFELSDSHSVEEIMNCIRKFRCLSQQKKTGYSAAMLARSSINDQLRFRSHASKWASESLKAAGTLGHMTSVDALKCLLKAPMLSDLEGWSHWDCIFAPTLGPMLKWLENEENSNNLVCLVTRSGKMLRIDGSATLDEFLAAVVKGCAKQTAIQFVSIVSLYGGTHHSPIALMKSHFRWAIGALAKNFAEHFEDAAISDMGKSNYCINCRKSWLGGGNFGCDSGQAAVLGESHTSVNIDYAEKSQNIEKPVRAVKVAARFLLDCFVCIPPEFHTFAAQIFLSGFGTLSADASQTILDECILSDERLMLHEIGLSIGITEWIKDYQVFSLNASLAGMSLLECQEGNNNIQSSGQDDTKCEAGINQLEGIHCSDLNSIEKKKNSPNEPKSQYLNDHGLVQAKSKDCVISMPKSEGSLRCGLVQIPDTSQEEDAKRIIEAIRCEEFGLDLEFQCNETNLLKKQHARLGRALHCLSQELYSRDSHFILELVQNADDNCYPAYVEPTLAFILQSTRVVVFNNELGFTAKNIRALCDVGNSTKKGSSAGYIGHKGIGFKSVFQVTDAPEIHSNGFHVKFDVTEGEIGFILPTYVAPLCNLNSLCMDLIDENNKLDVSVWKTCIVLPFKNSCQEGTGMRSCASKFVDLHPSLLLFLHRIRRIIVRDSLTNSLKIMRREDMGNGLLNVSHGKEKTTWLMASRKLNAGSLRPGVQTTEIAMAFALCEDQSGGYGPCLEQQPVFAFLPLRAYGFKFILQGDFILPSSREEVVEDNAWNQWLLSEFPELFVGAAVSFMGLPCYESYTGKAVTLYMRYVPLVGEVVGFFSPLPGMILSKLRASPCLPSESKDQPWVLPCKVLRGWTDQIRILLPDDLLNNHLGLGYLHRDVNLSDPLAAALGVHAYGPGILIEIMKSLCNKKDALRDLGLNWIGSWLVALDDCLRFQPIGPEAYLEVKQEYNFLNDLRKIPFIPLSDGSYTSLAEGFIWLPCEATEAGIDAQILKNFSKLYSELRAVHSSLFFTPTVGDVTVRGDSDMIVHMLLYVGVGQLSAHEVVMTHILQAMSSGECMSKDELCLTEYLAYTMLHLQSNCCFCYLEREKIILELQKKAVIVTNNGYKLASSEPLHFSREFGNRIDMRKILAGTNVVWNEIDSVYLQFSSSEVQALNLSQWRMFFKELGVTDFVQVLNVEKTVEDQSCSIWKDMEWDDHVDAVGWTVNDWESRELVDILTALSSSSKNVEQCSCLLEVLDNVWDDIFGAKRATYWSGSPDEKKGKYTEASCILEIRRHCWVKSKFNGKLCFPTDLFFDFDDVKSILGSHAPYANPQVHNRKLVAAIGFRTEVCKKDALNLLYEWSKSECIFKASTSQMGRLYSFLWTRMDTCKEEVASHFQVNSYIFVPLTDESNPDDMAEGMFYSVDQVYWRDPTGCLDLLKKGAPPSDKLPFSHKMCLRALYQIYPNLHNFFVNGCCVQESPDFDGYVKILQNLSRIIQPSKAYKEAIEVLYKWGEDVEFERVDCKEISRWKDCLHDFKCSVLPTTQGKWVSLHKRVGLVCWCDDVELGNQFRNCDGMYFIHLHAGGKFDEIRGKDTVPNKVITLMCAMGIPSLSE
ncbi:hypothetical protein KI387_032722, partial [Taxus chinensis]